MSTAQSGPECTIGSPGAGSGEPTGIAAPQSRPVTPVELFHTMPTGGTAYLKRDDAQSGR